MEFNADSGGVLKNKARLTDLKFCWEAKENANLFASSYRKNRLIDRRHLRSTLIFYKLDFMHDESR